MSEFSNVYEDPARAASYAQLEFPGTYYLAYRDLPEIIGADATGKDALDFGCGAGRSTRFLSRLGFDVIGADNSEAMLDMARSFDPDGDYRLIRSEDLSELPDGAFDLVQSVFTFDNIATEESKVRIFTSLKRLLKPGGRIVSLVSTPDIYVNEWASFSTKDFLTNRTAKSGDEVMTVMLDVEDRRPVVDVLCTHEDYLQIYQRAGLVVTERYLPLGRQDEPYAWVSETTIAPWSIYVLASQQT